MPLHRIKPDVPLTAGARHEESDDAPTITSDCRYTAAEATSSREERHSSVAYALVHDELMLDGNSRQNLATFCTTWIEPEVRQLMSECDRQEHDRQGRVSADRRDRVALRAHPRRSLALARRRDDDRLLDHRLERSGDARRARAEMALAEAAAWRPASPPIARIWSAARCRSAGRSSRATSTSSCVQVPTRRRRDRHDARPASARIATRTRSVSCRRWASPSPAPTSRSQTIAAALDALAGGDRPRHSDSRRRAPAAGSSPLSCNPSSSGTSGCRA